MMDVAVYTRYRHVRLLLNGRLAGQVDLLPSDKNTARFRLPYAAGTLRAVALDRNGKTLDATQLITAGPALRLRLTADRRNITKNLSDLCFVRAEVIDAAGRVVPDARVPVRFTVTGVGSLRASGNDNPADMQSFTDGVTDTWKGSALAILRPVGKTGRIVLTATAPGLKTAVVRVRLSSL